jgi:hypothetical protein
MFVALLSGCNLPDTTDQTSSDTPTTGNTINNGTNQPQAGNTNAPIVTTGDKWIYKYKEQGTLETILTELVSATRPDGGYTLKITSPDRSWNFTEQYTSNGMLISDTHGTRSEFLCSYSFVQPDVIFPIYVGKMVSGRRISTCTDGSTSEDFVRTITAYEKVTTAAGSFDTYKIETTTTITDPSLTPPQVTITSTEWYSPLLKNSVRTITNGMNGSATSELSSYSIH